MNFWIFVVLYFIIALVVYGVLVYNDGLYEDGFEFVVSIFWIAVLCMLIVASPFFFVRKFSLKLKKMKNLKSIDLRKC